MCIRDRKTTVRRKEEFDEDGRRREEEEYNEEVRAVDPLSRVVEERVSEYRNSVTGEEVISRERLLDNRGEKVVTERFRDGEERTRKFLKGLDEREERRFEDEWRRSTRGVDLEGLKARSTYDAGARWTPSRADELGWRPTSRYSPGRLTADVRPFSPYTRR
eukprot:TRINITY_DN14359_c0_g1_i1.p1 TRINITY_DN14359_c0_g1~~TRINITY_DN14359_c0_g1_i1.p1  ORF type:complete len:162 (+),score=54.89 TRINITY_DN14359_c0_g1_i1:64-549(+)